MECGKWFLSTDSIKTLNSSLLHSQQFIDLNNRNVILVHGVFGSGLFIYFVCLFI